MRTWDELQDASFFEATARERAIGLMDKGAFDELLGPRDRMSSPHLPALGEAISFDDGVVTGIGLLAARPVFMISQEGRFIGGAIGEVGGAKMTSQFELALRCHDEMKSKGLDGDPKRTPAVVISFDTGGVRLHEANAGLLAHAELMDLIQDARGKVPVIALIGSRVGCFGGMGFIAAAADVVIMSEQGRIGLTGPEVIEQEMGKKEFDASDKALVYRTTGGKNRYIMQDGNFLVADSVGAFRRALADVLSQPISQMDAFRRIGSLKLVEDQMSLVNLASSTGARDASEYWKLFGNDSPEILSDMKLEDFLRTAQRRPKS